MKRARIAYALALTLITVSLVTCSSDTDDTYRQPRSYPGGDDSARRGGFARTGSDDGLDVMPPADWWRDPQISPAVNLSADQLAALDRIGKDQGDEIMRLQRDSVVAARDVRQIVEGNEPSVADITAAGQRLRGIRDVLFDRRVQMLAAERTLLTKQQWETLQQQLANSRNRTDRPNRGNTGRGGRGGMGGRGTVSGIGLSAAKQWVGAAGWPRAGETMWRWVGGRVALTQDPKLDDATLIIALRSPAAFVGAMGSRRAQSERRERLLDAGLGTEELDRLSAPVGLDLGASSPQETALSILAEVVAVRHGHQGGRLRTRDGRIHAAAS